MVPYWKLEFTYITNFRTQSQGGKQDMRVDTIDVGAENRKSGMNYLKFILKASFPDARSRGKCVYA